jgi:hypothetical protein
MKKNILLVLLVIIASSCAKNKFVIMIENPSETRLDKLKIEINVDDKEVKNVSLVSTKVTPSYLTTEFFISKEENHYLKIKLKDTIFNYNLSYPSEKYIIISPYIKKNGRIDIGILKQENKFIFH